MDIDIGNILYIVITLVAVIVGLRGKKKKSTQETAEASEDTARPGFMENLERVLNMGQEEPMVADLEPYEEDLSFEEVTIEVEEPASILNNRPGIMDDYNRIMNRNTDGAVELIDLEGESMTETVELVDLDYVEGPDYFEIVENFDAGKAVVYSAILNRLDY